MESKTKLPAYTFLTISIIISILTKELNLLDPESFPLANFILNKIRVISFILASSLFIWRGIYFIRAQGYQHKYLAELVLGLFFVTAVSSTLYMSNEIGTQTLQIISVDSQFEDLKMREQILEIEQNTSIVQRGMLTWIGLGLISILLGLIWPIVNASNKSEETNQKPKTAF